MAAVEGAVQRVANEVEMGATEQYNATAQAHNQVQISKCVNNNHLLPLKNSAGLLPAGLFPRTVGDLRQLFQNARDGECTGQLAQLLEFYDPAGEHSSLVDALAHALLVPVTF